MYIQSIKKDSRSWNEGGEQINLNFIYAENDYFKWRKQYIIKNF